MFDTLFSNDLFMPHGHCYLWQPPLVMLQVIANAAIAAAYIAIFATLVYLVRRIRDIPFQWMYVAFAIFIVACGVTHIFDVVVIWRPLYWQDGAIRAITALASVGTAVLLPMLVPKAVALAEAASVAHERGMKLEEANREMALLLDKTTELERLKGHFFANVSHELRTPLALILGPTEELLKASNLNEQQRVTLEVVLRNGRSLLTYVNDLLDITKLDAGKLKPEYAEVDLAALVRLTASQFEPAARERQMRFEVNAPDSMIAQVDAPKLGRVLINLLSNAFKFTPRGGTVQCELVSHEETFSLLVSDSGPGIPASQRETVFERFRQLEDGKAGGTGLGLAIAKEMVELHRGSIHIEDTALGGARFRVDIPCRAPKGVRLGEVRKEALPELPAPPLTSSQLPPPSAEPHLDVDRPLVLVVEDHPELNRFLTQCLSAHFRVASAGHGREGLALASELHPDVIVTDMMMPEMSGEELLQALRADPALHEIGVIVLTAKADDDLRLRLLREGAQDYILKPFLADEVCVRVQNLVSTQRARQVLRTELNSKVRDVDKLAREVAQRHRELNTSLESLRIAKQQASTASAAKTKFLGMVSHELRTPITVLRLQTTRLRAMLPANEGERSHAVLTRLDATSLRLEQLVDSLLEYSRVQSGQIDVRVETADLGQLLESVVDEVLPQAEHKKLEIALQLRTQDLVTQTDPRLIHLIVINLITNAIKFTERGNVTVTIEGSSGQHRISVTDSGPGIPKEEQARIFVAFEQLAQLDRKHLPGIGLGLAIVRELADALGAQIHVDSVVGQGSTFTLELGAAAAAESVA